MEKIIGTVPGKCRKKREKARLTLNNNPEISWHMKKSRRTYNGVHLNKKSNTQDVVEQSLTLNLYFRVQNLSKLPFSLTDSEHIRKYPEHLQKFYKWIYLSQYLNHDTLLEPFLPVPKNDSLYF